MTYSVVQNLSIFARSTFVVYRDEYSTPSNLHGLKVDSKSVPNLLTSPSASSPIPALPVKMRRSMNSKIGISVKEPEIDIQPEQK